MSELVNEGARAKRDDEIECPGGRTAHTVAECLSGADDECPCRELHAAVRGMEHVIGLMQSRIDAAERRVADPQRDRELDRLAARDHVMHKALEDIAADCGGPILDAGSAAKRAAITLERIAKLLPGDDPKGEEIKRLRAEVESLRG